MGKSLLARIAPLYFRMGRHCTEAEATALLHRRQALPEPPPRAPRGIAYRLETRECGKVFYLNEQRDPARTVFYLHGGAYWNDFSPFHWRYLKKLIRATNAEILAPAYRLAPYGTAEDAFSLLVPLYTAYRAAHPHTKVVLMGDSAGGGMALAFAEYCAANGLPAPDELILFSPWVDVTMQNPALAEYAPRDPWLTLSLRVPGLWFAGDMDLRDYRINPIYGDVSRLRNILLITGTRELLYPDTMRLAAMLQNTPSYKLIEGQDMLHVYPLMPIREADDANACVIKRILR